MRSISYLGHDVQILSSQLGAEIYVDSLGIAVTLTDPDIGHAVEVARKLVEICR